MPNSPLRTKLLLAFTLLILGFSIIPASAQTEPITMNVTPAFQGYFKYGEWLPVWVNLENSGPDLEGEVQVRVVRDFEQITYAVPVSLPSGARKRIPVYVLPNNFSHELKVDFVINDELIQSQKIVVQPQPNINYVIGIAARERGALALLPGIRLPGNRSSVLVDVALENLPERPEALRTLDSLILNDIDTSSLTPAQTQALVGWVQQGGRLVIGGGAGALQTTAGLPDELLTLQPDGLTEIESLDELTEYAGTSSIEVPGPFVVTTGEILQGQTLAEQGDDLLIQEVKSGKGYSTFVALDLSTSPFNAWTGTYAFWETLITPGATYPNWMPPDMSERQMTTGPIGNALSNIPSLDLPSASAIVILLAIYIILVGPVNYLVLRWRKKLQWAWVTIPLITLIFTAMSFGIGYAKRGTDLIINKIAILQPQPDGPAQVSSYLGLFSPANQAYQIEVTGNNLLSPMENYYSPWSSTMGPGGSGNLTFVQSDPSLVRGLTVNQWSMQSFMTETSLEGVHQVSSDLRIDGEELVGTITNDSGYSLKDVILIFRPNYTRLGDLEPGESAEVNLPFTNFGDRTFGSSMSWRIFDDEFTPSMMGPPPRELEFKRMVLEAVLDQEIFYGSRFDPSQDHSAKELDATLPEAQVVAWMDNAPPEVRINGQIPQESATALYVSPVSYQIPESGEIIIPPGMIPGLIAEMPFSGGVCGPDTASLWIEQGEAVVEFILLPEFTNINLDTLQFAIHTDGGWVNSPDIAIYDWENDQWQPLVNPIIGENVIADPIYYINPEGLVRIRLSPSNQELRGGGCYFFGLGLKGRR
jgi:hypothetical protein